MIEKHQGRITFICDDCGEERDSFDEGDGLTFGGAWARLKEDGWRGAKNANDGVFEHFGPNCVRAFVADGRARKGGTA